MPNLRDIVVTISAKADQLNGEVDRVTERLKRLERQVGTGSQAMRTHGQIAAQSAGGLRGLTGEIGAAISSYARLGTAVAAVGVAITASSRVETQ